MIKWWQNDRYLWIQFLSASPKHHHSSSFRHSLVIWGGPEWEEMKITMERFHSRAILVISTSFQAISSFKNDEKWWNDVKWIDILEPRQNPWFLNSSHSTIIPPCQVNILFTTHIVIPSFQAHSSNISSFECHSIILSSFRHYITICISFGHPFIIPILFHHLNVIPSFKCHSIIRMSFYHSYLIPSLYHHLYIIQSSFHHSDNVSSFECHSII